MRIAVDARPLNREHLRGIGKVLTKVIEHSDEQVDWVLLADRPELPFHQPKHPRVRFEVFDQRGYRLDTWQQWALPRRVRQLRPDVLLSPMNSAPLWQPCRTVVVVHDTIPWQSQWAEGSGKSNLRDRLASRAIVSADAVVTISQSSAADILGLWPSVSGRLTVIHNGVDESLFGVAAPSAEKEPLVKSPYFVYFGGDVPRKRLDWALKTFINAGLENARLVLCGVDDAAASRFLEDAPADARRRIIVPGFVAEGDLHRLIAGSLGVLYPTLYEGFGLPCLEAQACGVACLMSPVSSLKELAGPGAVCVDPYDLDAWVDAARRLYSAGGLGEDRRTAARLWAAQYSWSRCGKEYLRLLRDIGEASNNQISGAR